MLFRSATPPRMRAIPMMDVALIRSAPAADATPRSAERVHPRGNVRALTELLEERCRPAAT